MTTASESSEQNTRYQEVKKVTLVGAVVNSLLAIVKITLGFIGQSQALIADGVHSLADLISDIIVVIAAKHGSRQADDDHPYGHGRFETVVEVGLGLFLIAVAVGIMIDASGRIFEPDRLMSPTWYALIAAVFSIVANEGLFQYTIAVARKIKSNLLKANAWHHRTDAISSVIALIGIAGTMAGFPLLDAIAAIGVSILIAKVGWDIAYSSLKELVDTALDAEKVEQIREVILNVDGVKAVHSLRTRSMGAHALVDVHILVVNSHISVSEGHQISERVLKQLKERVDEVADVTVHIDPEDDEVSAPCSHLPLRKELLTYLDSLFSKNEFYPHVQQTVFHYLDGKVHVEFVLPASLISQKNSAGAITSSFQEFDDEKALIANVRILFIA